MVSRGRVLGRACWCYTFAGRGFDRSDGVRYHPSAWGSAEDALRRYLAERRSLLVIDNFEHLLDAAGLFSELLALCPRLTVMTTSREVLALAGEHRVVVEPLPVPTLPSGATVGQLEETPATALFLATARRLDSRFVVPAGMAPLVAEVCCRLDGLPLALELAAAATSLLGGKELAAGVDSVMEDVAMRPRDAPVRQRTLHATVEWSYGLLDVDQQAAFIRFAVFAGGASLHSAQAITGATFTTLHSLVAKSLLYRRQNSDGVVRLAMLETIRQFALGRLLSDSERDGTHRRHCDYYLHLVEQTVPQLSSHGEREALAVLDAELDNLRAALQWSLRVEPVTGLRLAGQLGEYWMVRFDREGLRWLDAALDAAGDSAPLTDRARARFYHSAQLGVFQAGEARMNGVMQALVLYRDAGDHAGISRSLRTLALASGSVAGNLSAEREYANSAYRHARLAGDDTLMGEALGTLAAVSADRRGALLERAIGLLTPLGNYRAIATAFSGAAYVALTEDRLNEASGYLKTALEAAERIDDPSITMLVFGNIGLARLFSGDALDAAEAFERQLQLCRKHSFHLYACEPIVGLAAVAAAQGRFETAGSLRAAARACGYPPTQFDRPIDERLEREYFAVARDRMGDAEWRRAEQANAGVLYETAIEYASLKAHEIRRTFV